MHTMMPIALWFIVLFSWFSLTEGTGKTCVGIRQQDSYDFQLPDDVVVNVQDDRCDAEWTIDQWFPATLDGRLVNFSPPFKNVTQRGISVGYCPVYVRFHVSCPKYTKELTCSCTNFTEDRNSVFNTTPPSRAGFEVVEDMSSLPSNQVSSVRHHYCTVPGFVCFVLTLVALAFLICRADRRASADEQKQPG